jgi:hypothetical protein
MKPQVEGSQPMSTPPITADRIFEGQRIPWWVKIVYTAFVCLLVPIYLKAYGPTNFLYFCDVALLLTVPALWLESPLLASMPTVGILLPQSLWMADFLGGIVGKHITGMTEYMFNPELPLFTRGLSFFHFWLPLLLLWATYRLGYDRRAFVAWTILAWVLLLVCYFFMPAPPPPKDNPDLPVNINYVYGLTDSQPPQTWMPPLVYLALLMIGMPLGIFLPTHLLLRWLFPQAPVKAAPAPAAAAT